MRYTYVVDVPPFCDPVRRYTYVVDVPPFRDPVRTDQLQSAPEHRGHHRVAVVLLDETSCWDAISTNSMVRSTEALARVGMLDLRRRLAEVGVTQL